MIFFGEISRTDNRRLIISVCCLFVSMAFYAGFRNYLGFYWANVLIYPTAGLLPAFSAFVFCISVVFHFYATFFFYKGIVQTNNKVLNSLCNFTLKLLIFLCTYLVVVQLTVYFLEIVGLNPFSGYQP